MLCSGAPPSVQVASDLDALIASIPDAVCIGVDMPIGLPGSVREADNLARAFVGVRRNSIFLTPPAKVLEASSYEAANLIAPTLIGGKKISQQAWALRSNIHLVAEIAARDTRVIEVHPEVSFRRLAGTEVGYSKATWNGQHSRRRWLSKAGIDLPDHLAAGGEVPVADILDAAAAAWSARRYAEGRAESLPPNATVGEKQVIWY